jgi:hypothetical protein
MNLDTELVRLTDQLSSRIRDAWTSRLRDHPDIVSMQKRLD